MFRAKRNVPLVHCNEDDDITVAPKVRSTVTDWEHVSEEKVVKVLF